ncbi:MAG: hypothetical protein ACYS26_22300, partial [Planctomycetota bacterium]
GFDASKLEWGNFLSSEAEARSKIENSLLFGTSSPDPEDPYAKLKKHADDRFPVDPLAQDPQRYLSRWGGKGVELTAAQKAEMQAVLDSFRPAFEDARRDYDASYIGFRAHQLALDGGYHISPMFDDPRIDQIKEGYSATTKTGGMTGQGWTYLFYFDESSAPGHSVLYQHIMDLKSARRRAMEDFFLTVKGQSQE